MAITTSTSSSCHISPQSFMVVHTSPSPTFTIPKSTLSTSKSRSGSMSLATSGPVRRVIARSFSVSTPSSSVSMASASWYPVVPVQTHSGFDVFIDAQGSVHDPYFGEMDLATSSRLLRMEYLANSGARSTKDYDEKENSNVNEDSPPMTPQSIPSRRTRERTRSANHKQEPTASRSAPTTNKMARETMQTRRNDKVEIAPRESLGPWQSALQQPQQPQKAVKMNFWEAEIAMKKDLEEDDYAWYYRNPQRHIWRPRNPRKRMQRRKRVMYGVATGEEGAPTNRSLFVSYLMQHFPSTLLLPPLGFDAEKSSRGAVGVKTSSSTGRSLHGLVVNALPLGSVNMNEDWQEDLFSPDEYEPSCNRRFKRASRSSLYSECSHCSDSSADSSQR